MQKKKRPESIRITLATMTLVLLTMSQSSGITVAASSHNFPFYVLSGSYGHQECTGTQGDLQAAKRLAKKILLHWRIVAEDETFLLLQSEMKFEMFTSDRETCEQVLSQLPR